MSRISLFVYGTLMTGECNHAAHCQGLLKAEPARLWGRLLDLPAGYPGLQVDARQVLAHGTTDPLVDAHTQATVPPVRFERPTALPGHPQDVTDWDLVEGELLHFDDPACVLPPMDRLEDFVPGQPSLYQRVLMAVQTDTATVPAWLYWMPDPVGGTRWRLGRWRGHR